MAAREVVYFAAPVASGATLSSEVDIGKSYQEVFVQMASGTTFEVFLQGARSPGGSFSRIYFPPTDSTPAVAPIEIASAAAGANGGIVPIPHFTRYMKLEFATAVADGGTYYFICRD